MKTKPREVLNEKTGRYSVYAPLFSFHVDDYDSSSYTVYNDSGRFAQFIRESSAASYEDACHRALNQARINMPVVAKKKKTATITNGKHAAAPKPKRAVVEDDDDENEEEEEKPKTTKRMAGNPARTGKARGNPREYYDLEFKLKGTKFSLTGNFDTKGHDSNTGRSTIRITTAGLWDTGLSFQGKPIIVAMNCFTSKKDAAPGGRGGLKNLTKK